jgi:hypothetical protein
MVGLSQCIAVGAATVETIEQESKTGNLPCWPGPLTLIRRDKDGKGRKKATKLPQGKVNAIDSATPRT